MGAVVSCILYPIVVMGLTIWKWVIRDEFGNPLPNTHIRLTFDTPTPSAIGHTLDANVTLLGLDPSTGIADWKWEGVDAVGQATGFHHFDYHEERLKFSPDRHEWVPNGTFYIEVPNQKRDVEGGEGEDGAMGATATMGVAGTWVLIDEAEAEAVAAHIEALSRSLAST